MHGAGEKASAATSKLELRHNGLNHECPRGPSNPFGIPLIKLASESLMKVFLNLCEGPVLLSDAAIGGLQRVQRESVEVGGFRLGWRILRSAKFDIGSTPYSQE
jgi:hypothetical protein